MKRILLIGGVCAALVVGLWAAVQVHSVAMQIKAQSMLDETMLDGVNETNNTTQTADVIVVLGAAEYNGRPSPVLERRLNHALFLYLQNKAPYILTTGGAGGDPTFTEGEVAHNYLSRHGVPSEAILVENEGESTVHSTTGAAEIMQRMMLKSCIVVSDGYHIYRVKKMLESRGFKVQGSPRPEERPADENSWRQYWVYVRQAIAYELWRIGIPV